MNSLDLIIGPIYFILLLASAWFFRPLFTSRTNRIFFIPALALKMIAAVGLGLLYKFYYVGEGGDTFGFYEGARRIWLYFIENPVNALRVIFWNGDYAHGMYQLVSRIPNYMDPPSFFMSRIAGFLGIFSFGNYSGIALLFATISFSGSWALYSSLEKLYPKANNALAVAILFIPSVVFWGSGILKDTITFSALGWTLWGFINIVSLNRRKIISLFVFAISLFIIFSIKKYILLVLIPSLIFWYYLVKMDKIRIRLLRFTLAPLILILVVLSGYRAVIIIGEDDPKYSVQNISQTVYITAYDIRYWTGKEAGSGYSLGDVPESWQDMIRLFPAAVNVTFFRPYLWEVSNPLMLILALESLVFFIVVLYIILKYRLKLIRILSTEPFLVFALIFSIGFAYAVGISTWNFGTLVRYKIPMMPIFASLIAIVYWQARIFIQKGQFKSEP